MRVKTAISTILGIAAFGATIAPALADEYISETRSFSQPSGECSSTKTTTTTTLAPETSQVIERRTVVEQPVVIERAVPVERRVLIERPMIIERWSR